MKSYFGAKVTGPEGREIDAESFVFYNRDTGLCLASRSSWEGTCVRLEEGTAAVMGQAEG